ncbi:hypothetical protein K445DRAFT_77133 [Daldinia sp. EC12]|nr:hypothetical protein K445DRAFT_77133 [Daldinia sp. EC12]
MAYDLIKEALLSNNFEELASFFYAEQAYWREIVTLTSHLRIFSTPGVIAKALVHTKDLRGITGNVELTGDTHFVVVNPTIIFIDCGILFRTTSPALSCIGKMLLLPVIDNAATGSISWKVWTLSAWVENIVQHPEDEARLMSPSKSLDGLDTVETDVFILGAGSSVIVYQNAKLGDNWTNRYGCLQFHVPTLSCELPYAYYPKDLRTPHRLTKDEVAEHLRQYATNFHLDVILLTISLSSFDTSEKKWTVKLKTTDGKPGKTVFCKDFAQATGIGCQIPNIPTIKDKHLFKGLDLHSVGFRNVQSLSRQGIKSVAIIGLANTAFEIMRDCYAAGLKTTMVARSPTCIFPYEYVMNPHSFGAYDNLSLEVADRILYTLPPALDGQFSHGLLSQLASQEPDRYLSLAQAGLPVLDSRDPSFDVQSILNERGGGHYVDVAVRGLVEPVGYTEAGLLLSDGSFLNADAVIWCTGIADTDVRTIALGVFGGTDPDTKHKSDVLNPADITARLDATWGVDAEGEVCGVWKRHLRMDNYWVIGGAIQHQRWWSRPMA